jgi:MarR family multiple gene transcriptional regulator MgrA
MQNRRLFFKQFDLTNQQYNALRILRGKSPEPASQHYIKERLIDKSSDISRLIDRLAQKELVSIHVSESDKRAKYIFISEKGLSILTKIDNNQTTINKTTLCLNEVELTQLNRLLNKLLSA